MDQRLADLTRGFRERINRLAIFDPLYELGRKVSRDQQNNPIDWFSLGMVSLLFFFESMLTRRRQTSVKDLAAYLQEMNQEGPISADEAGFQKIAREIIDAFRDASGKRKEKVFFNWETRQEERIYYSLIEVSDSDLSQNIQNYRLTERGLELIFATKEYFSEFHLSISQLVLRKQLEKGELNGALREIDEMRIAVEQLQRKMIQLNLEVQRNIISHETQKKYTEILDAIHSRLTREEEEFRELYGFVLEKKRKLEYEMTAERDIRAYNLLIQIAKELDEVHRMHRSLLHDSITLKRKALHAAKESLYHAGLIAFNFNQDVTSRVVTSPMPAFALEGLIKPLLGPYVERNWSPLDVFAPQRTGGDDEGEWEIPHFAEADDRTEDPSYLQQQRQNFHRLSQELQAFLGEKTEIRLSEFLEYLQADPERAPFVENRSLYDYWLLLHQRTPLQIHQGRNEDGKSYLLDDIIAAFSHVEEIEVQEEPELLQPHPRYEIQEMILRLKVNA
ncbi:replicative DNA helicase [Heliobacillus mobilis]|uniref:Replicative DNA helicase n=1 Tax=Heliobacterium mobile TaxID=28064 RepID=A0A6I3SN00_HELMO|nr:replicative DNA helicase [Heliobacterium mobile]MTV50371.1 replicative DNA helicase [Heliobacterium mobile]